MVCGVKASWPGQKGQDLRFGQVVSPSSWTTQFMEMGSFRICIDPPTRCRAAKRPRQVYNRGSKHSACGSVIGKRDSPAGFIGGFRFLLNSGGCEWGLRRELLMPSDLVRATRSKHCDQPRHPHSGGQPIFRRLLNVGDPSVSSPPHQATMAFSKSLAKSSGPAGRGESLVTRCWGSVPSTSRGMSAVS